MLRTPYVNAIVLVFALLVPSAVASAGDRDFDAVVSHLEHSHHAKKRGSVGLGFARFFVKIAKPAGVKSLRVAMLEDLAGAVDGAALDRSIREQLDADWSPFVRVFSRLDGEHAFVYTRAKGDDIEFLVVAVDGDEATVVKTRVDLEHVIEWIANQDFARGHGG
jgi:hypothetical protein